MKPISAVLLSLLIAACIPSNKELVSNPGWPGYLSTNVSAFDGATEARLEPAWTLDGELLVGLRWRTAMGDEVRVLAGVKGAHNFKPDADFRFKIDGETIALSPVDRNDYGESETRNLGHGVQLNYSEKEFFADRSFVDAVINGKLVVARAELLRSYVEGRLSARPGEMQHHEIPADHFGAMAFRKFREQVWP